MSVKKTVGVIIGSTRTHRVGGTIAQWFVDNSGISEDFNVEIIDLAKENLPLYDEALPPMALNGVYSTEHGKRWQAKIGALDSFVFVTSEYNRGYPAALKNAIDYLWKEWCDKPAAIVSYGWSHGGQFAGEQLSQIISGMSGIQTKLVSARPKVFLSRDIFNESGKIADPNTSFAKYNDDIKKAVEELKAKF
ncbi:NADPH-dependent FMN reductase family protein [Heterostelium album PN500]|uniref:NADPH-dependent FMN reductase family protein n=1 Tax=Heterostelium pallidum (strain ATCC 26659 / Pp 5 / PN500) TaxID=670386 RepID=D3AWT1_HETP5|nr:NADPH-dependent FMN reductase family protein [Heterostelium album PN500]EFA86754.1 NADPH-dependent FMN reductase family protein [Heterostelium album PN500]|eukprot:XP_020438858.1 NADPH-dependent FMN reductase family protein [Heterostelium album PN500]